MVVVGLFLDLLRARVVELLGEVVVGGPYHGTWNRRV